MGACYTSPPTKYRSILLVPMRITNSKTLEKSAARQSFSPPSVTDGSVLGSERRQPAVSVAPRKKALCVFLVDDSRLITERLSALLTTVEGVQIVGVARTTSAAIRGIRHLVPDLVILDFQMPDGNGLEVLKAVKQGHSSPLVMMLTNFNYPQYRAECMQWGANYFFDKSQDFERLIETCRQLIPD